MDGIFTVSGSLDFYLDGLLLPGDFVYDPDIYCFGPPDRIDEDGASRYGKGRMPVDDRMENISPFALGIFDDRRCPAVLAEPAFITGVAEIAESRLDCIQEITGIAAQAAVMIELENIRCQIDIPVEDILLCILFNIAAVKESYVSAGKSGTQRHVVDIGGHRLIVFCIAGKRSFAGHPVKDGSLDQSALKSVSGIEGDDRNTFRFSHFDGLVKDRDILCKELGVPAFSVQIGRVLQVDQIGRAHV